MKKLVFLCLLGLAELSCVSSRRTVAIEPLEPEEILRRVHERIAGIKTLEAEGTLTMESPENSGSVSFELQRTRPDSLRMKFTGPFGISLGTLVLTKDRFSFYSRRDGKVIRGEPRPEVLSRLFNVALEYTQIFDAFVGGFGDFDPPMPAFNASVEAHQFYVLRTGEGTQRRELRVDGESFVVTGFLETDADGRPVLTAASDGIELDDGVYMPRLIRIVLPKSRQSVTVWYSSLAVNHEFRKRISVAQDANEIETIR